MIGPSLQDLHRLLWHDWRGCPSSSDGGRRQWWAALTVIQEHFAAELEEGGVWLAAPLPALHEPRLLQALQGWVWAPEQWTRTLLPPLLSPQSSASMAAYTQLLLQAEDGDEPFLILVTRRLQLAIALGNSADGYQLLVRFDPAVLSEALVLLDQRLLAERPELGHPLREALWQLGDLSGNSDNAGRFWSAMAARLATMAPSLTIMAAHASRPPALVVDNNGSGITELELLEALSHEIRTPLATIRIWIRSLRKRKNLEIAVRNKLEQMDAACSEQIDRFGLIFRAAELHRQPGAERQLARTDLASLIQQSFPGWQAQLSRRGLHLKLHLERLLPEVMSDPLLLEPMLGSLVDRFSRGMAEGNTVDLELKQAGLQLRLDLRSEGEPAADGTAADGAETSLGDVLTWNPETGSLRLSADATRHLFSHLGGRIAQRNGRHLTLFLPLA